MQAHRSRFLWELPAQHVHFEGYDARRGGTAMSLVDSQGKASRYNEQRKTASATAEAIVEASKIVQETATLRYEPERPTVQ